MRRLFAALVLVLFGSVAAACPPEPSMSVAAAVARDINTMATFTTTSCVPGAAGSRCTMICISQHTIDRFQPWSAVVVAAAGLHMRRDNPSRWDSIAWADRTLLERRQYRRMSAARAVALQRAISSDQISLEQFFARLDRESLVVPIPARQGR